MWAPVLDIERIAKFIPQKREEVMEPMTGIEPAYSAWEAVSGTAQQSVGAG
jgi:hypothetical protein